MMKSPLYSYIISLLLVLLPFMVQSNTPKSTIERHREVALRMVGHQVLLKSGDSSSRVLPITHRGDSYTIRFESGFHFLPEELKSTIDRFMTKADLGEHYTVEVQQCDSGEVVYSYEIGTTISTNLVPCSGRAVPSNCYNLVFTFQDANIIGATDQLDSSALSSPLRKIAKMGSWPIYPFLIIGILLLGGVVATFRKKSIPAADQTHLITIGSFTLDTRSMELIHGKDKTYLSGKESDLLLMLTQEANNTISRERILQSIWADEGDYIGRTLDVFISKLRKKLEADPTIKIVNIRGVGYKLILGS
ncbi:MAG TPA: winged helix-turn-helix domain-containing protein [Saprospiraceae bacterium]|nr:winged helix-turn-helix domain-containing protein [Saprospiraceae bacterium]